MTTQIMSDLDDIKYNLDKTEMYYKDHCDQINFLDPCAHGFKKVTSFLHDSGCPG